jgi:hypothetical protein
MSRRRDPRPIPAADFGARTIAPVRVAFAGSDGSGELGARIARMLGRDQEIEAQRVSGEARAAGLNAGLSGELPDRTAFGSSIADQAYLRGAEEGALNRLQLQVREKLDALSLARGSDVAGLASDIDDYRNGLAQGIPDSLRPQFDFAFDQLRLPLVNQAARLAQRAVADERIASFDAGHPSRLSAIQRNARAAEIDPAAASALTFELDAYNRDLAALGPREGFEWRGRRFDPDPGRAGALTLAQIEQRASALDREAAENMVMGAWSRGPRTREWIDAFEKRELDPKTGAGLSEEQTMTLAQRMHGEWARDEAQRREKAEAARTGLTEDMRDELAHLRATGRPLNLVAVPRIAAAGRDAAAWRREADLARKAYEIDQRLALASPEDVAKMRAELAPKAGPGYALAVEYRNEFERAAARRATAIERDPAAWVTANSPQLQALTAKAAEDPRAAREALSLNFDLQARLGVPEHARRALSLPQAEDLVGRIQAAPPEAMADAMQTLAARWGGDWPRVYRDLAAAKLPDEYRVLAGMADPTARRALAEAFQSEREKRGALRELAGQDAKAAAEAVRDELRPLAVSLRQAADGAAQVERHAGAAELLALRFMQQGAPAADAARRAARAVVLDRYDFVDSGGLEARVPKGEGTAIARRAAELRNGLQAATLDPPPARANETLTEAQRRAGYLRDVQRNGVWITGPGDDRLILLDGARQPVMRADGTLVDLPFGGKP